MLKNNEIEIGDKYILKKNHACGFNLWSVIKLGVDVKLKCVGCGHEIVMPRVEFLKRVKKKVTDENEKKSK